MINFHNFQITVIRQSSKIYQILVFSTNYRVPTPLII